MSKTTRQYTHEHFLSDVGEIIKDFREYNCSADLIVGVNRGGCLPAVCLSHALGIPCTMIDQATRDGVNISPESLHGFFKRIGKTYKHVLLVDDIIDSSITMSTLIFVANPFIEVSVATLLLNDDVSDSIDCETFYGTLFSRSREPRYFDFWWEKGLGEI